jgi:hypothetical protein
MTDRAAAGNAAAETISENLERRVHCRHNPAKIQVVCLEHSRFGLRVFVSNERQDCGEEEAEAEGEEADDDKNDCPGLESLNLGQSAHS